MLFEFFCGCRGFCHRNESDLSLFIRPSSDGTYYGMVMSVRPGLRPSVRHSFPHFSPTCFDILIWNFVYHLIFMHVRSSSNAINFRLFLLLFNFKLLQICSFPHFSPTCFDILSSNFVYDFVLMYHRASLCVVILLQFLLGLCLFVILEFSKYSVFRTFLLHALTYWAEILHMTFTVLQIKFECRQFASIFVGVMHLLELRILEIHSFPHFSLTPFNILSWKFAYYFVFLY